jgi:hypothetical protein
MHWLRPTAISITLAMRRAIEFRLDGCLGRRGISAALVLTNGLTLPHPVG